MLLPRRLADDPGAVMTRIIAVYHVRADAHAIERRAVNIAVEQSVEITLTAIDDPYVLSDIAGRVEGIAEIESGLYEVRIGLAPITVGSCAGHLLNMLFGNTSIHDDVELYDVEFPAEVLALFGGPRHGLEGLRRRVGLARGRAMTCATLKPQGLSSAALADLARRLARGGVDFVKDDHGLADQLYSPFAERVHACAAAVAEANAETGGFTCYVPSLSGNLDQLRSQLHTAQEAGINTVLIAPMVVGLPSMQAVVRDTPGMAFIAHPAMAGSARIAPPLLLGKLFRLLGADATVFPNHGGRFGYSPLICQQLAEAALAGWGDLLSCVPVPAGGMTLERVPEMLDFYGPDVMVLIGGGLLAAGARLTDETAAFASLVHKHAYG